MAEGGQHGYRFALACPVVRRLWIASITSTVGDSIGLGALLFLAADRTGSALGTAAVLAVGVVPSMLTGVLGGRWLDRFPRARALAAIQVVGACVILLPVAMDGAAIVYLTAALLAMVRIATIAVRSGAVAEGVEHRRRGPLVALMGSTDQAAQVLGYLTGGALYVLFGANLALTLDAVSFLLGAVVLLGLRLPDPGRRPAAPPVAAGLRDILGDPVLRLLAGCVVVTGTVASLPEVLAPSVAGAGDPWRPVLLAAAPAGQVIAMTLLGRSAHLHRPLVQLTHFAGLGLALGVASLAPGPATIAAANVLVGAGVAWLVGPQLLFMQRAPKVRMAQVTGTMIAMLALADGLGSLGYAAVADRLGVAAAYAAGAVVLCLSAAVALGLRARSEEVRALDAVQVRADAAAG